MRYRTRINNLYNTVLFKDRFNTPYYVFYDNGYYEVHKTGTDFKKKFNTFIDAEDYIYNINDNPLIIVFDFHNRQKKEA